MSTRLHLRSIVRCTPPKHLAHSQRLSLTTVWEACGAMSVLINSGKLRIAGAIFFREKTELRLFLNFFLAMCPRLQLCCTVWCATARLLAYSRRLSGAFVRRACVEMRVHVGRKNLGIVRVQISAKIRAPVIPKFSLVIRTSTATLVLKTNVTLIQTTRGISYSGDVLLQVILLSCDNSPLRQRTSSLLTDAGLLASV